MTISLTIVGFDLFIVSRTLSIKNYRSYILYKFLVISLSVRQKPVKKNSLAVCDCSVTLV